jgi:superfamily II RNA helicase
MVIICSNKYPPENESKYKEHFDLFPYDLSDFQKYSIEATVEGHHSLITAHTGSGKSLPAEFAIQFFTAKKENKKVIYTSPIKALSNQKYYEFVQKYPHISFGIMTGDMKVNPEAEVVIMTTEILMNSLFIGDSSTDDLACVIFDEVHYINDAERGRVWEQAILMLPEHVQMVMLSATIDAPEKFAKWCEKPGSNKVVYLSSTNARIVPLVHYGYMVTNEGALKKIKDKEIQKRLQESTDKLIPLKFESGIFNDAGYKEIKTTLDLMEGRQTRQHVLNRLAQHLRDREMLPAIAFVFSRKHAELLANEITVPLLEFDSKVAYIVRRECEQIVRRLPNHAEYLGLPEYNQLVSLLEKGIGVHHSGMIPILREIVEMMISKKYIKILFATESFAIGLNCPIRTAVFTSLTKYDGHNMRFLLPHEYNQAASRCGRRGIDTIGHVVHCNNLFDLPMISEYKTILCGTPQSLVSKFRISFPVVLNLMRNNKCRLDDFVDFVDKSMITRELTNCLTDEHRYRADLQIKYDSLSQMLIGLRTPIEICNRYLEVKSTIPLVANKRKKELERELTGLVDAHRTCVIDSEQVVTVKRLTAEMSECDSKIKYLETFSQVHVKIICNILEDQGFIREPTTEPSLYKESMPSLDKDSMSYIFTNKGRVASGIAEVHPLVVADCIEHWFDLTPRQLVGLLSCFTDVKIGDDSRSSVPKTPDQILKKHIVEIESTFHKYDDIERAQRTDPAYNYSDPLIFDMIDYMMDWCDCSNEDECKIFIQEVSSLCSVGDFTKAIMKISAIVKELTAVCEQNGYTDFMYKLSLIDGMILKYVATTQSLYV